MAQSLFLSTLKWTVMFVLWVAIVDQEFHSIILLIIFLVFSGLELYSFGMFMVASIYLLGLLGGLVVITSFVIKMCSSSHLQPPFRLGWNKLLMIGSLGVLFFQKLESIPPIEMPMWASSNLFQSHLSLYVFLIGLLMIMLFILEDMTTLKGKGMPAVV